MQCQANMAIKIRVARKPHVNITIRSGFFLKYPSCLSVGSREYYFCRVRVFNNSTLSESLSSKAMTYHFFRIQFNAFVYCHLQNSDSPDAANYSKLLLVIGSFEMYITLCHSVGTGTQNNFADVRCHLRVEKK